VVSTSDDFDEFIDEFKKMFNVDSDGFEVDFLFIPESSLDLNSDYHEEKVKGFKISYHFEAGMEKPEIKIEGVIDEKQIREQLKGIDLNKYPNLRNILKSRSVNEIDAANLNLSLDTFVEEDDSNILVPYTEIIDKKDSTEIVLETPGIKENNVNIEFNEDGNQLIFSAENGVRRYSKTISLSFKSSKKDCELEVNNGITILKARKSE